jgi:hypothetical protein
MALLDRGSPPARYCRLAAVVLRTLYYLTTCLQDGSAVAISVVKAELVDLSRGVFEWLAAAAKCLCGKVVARSRVWGCQQPGVTSALSLMKT